MLKINFWDKTTKTMMRFNDNFDSLSVVDGELKPFLNSLVYNNENWYKRDYIPLMSTGVKDKNGKEIFQGDILYIGTYSYEEPINEYKGTVEFDDTIMAFVLNGEDCNGEKDKYLLSDLIREYYYVDINIIGNSYENSELLED